MAAPWTSERQWRSARVRHSPPPSDHNKSSVHHLPPPNSPPVPALRAKTAHPSMSVDLQRETADGDDNDEIIEDIQDVFDQLDIDDDDDIPSAKYIR